jgi:hypothetical protein
MGRFYLGIPLVPIQPSILSRRLPHAGRPHRTERGKSAGNYREKFEGEDRGSLHWALRIIQVLYFPSWLKLLQNAVDVSNALFEAHAPTAFTPQLLGCGLRMIGGNSADLIGNALHANAPSIRADTSSLVSFVFVPCPFYVFRRHGTLQSIENILCSTCSTCSMSIYARVRNNSRSPCIRVRAKKRGTRGTFFLSK